MSLVRRQGVIAVDPVIATGAPILRTVTSYTNSNVAASTAYSFSNIVPRPTDLLVVAIPCTTIGGSDAIASVTYGGTTMVQQGSPVITDATSSAREVTFFVLPNPTVGTANVVITTASSLSSGSLAALACNVSGAGGTFGLLASSSSTSTASLTATVHNGVTTELVLAVCAARSTSAVSGGSGVSESNRVVGSNLALAVSAIPGASTVASTYSWTTADEGALVLLPIQAVPTTPHAPTIQSATAGTTSVTIAFTPATTGAAASSYTVTMSSGQTASGIASPITVSGLTAGTAVTARVSATNSAGSSALSAASSSVTPTASTGMNLQQPNWTTTTVMSNLSPSASDNLAAINSYISAASANTKLVFPAAGTYKFSDNIDIHSAGIGLFGATSTASDTVLLSTHVQVSSVQGGQTVYQSNRGLRVYANNVFMKCFTHSCDRQSGDVRSSQDEQGDSTLLLETGYSGFSGEDLVLDQACATGFFSYGATNYQLNRVVSQFSYADSFHNTNGSSYYTFTDCTANQTGLDPITQGDDSFANVFYSGNATASHHGTFIRCKSYNSSSRGASVISCHDITFTDFYAINSWRPGVYIGNEQADSDCSTYNVTFNGTTILKNCCCGTSGNGIGNGSLFVLDYSGSSGGSNISCSNVAIIDVSSQAGFGVRAGPADYNGTITATLNSFKFYGTMPNNNGYNDVYNTGSGPFSGVVLTNWENLTAEPNNNWTATVHPESEAPSPPVNGF